MIARRLCTRGGTLLLVGVGSRDFGAVRLRGSGSRDVGFRLLGKFSVFGFWACGLHGPSKGLDMLSFSQR